MAHSSYKGKYIEAITEDIEPFCLNKTGNLGIIDACEAVQSVEESFPKVMNLFFNDPADKIKTIVTFRNYRVNEGLLKNQELLVPALKAILGSVLVKTKLHTLVNENEGMVWKEALKIQYDDAVREGVNPGMGSNLEHEISTSLNLNSSKLNKSAVAWVEN